MYVIRLLDLEMMVDAMTEVSATDKEKADLLHKVRSVIQIACEDKSAKDAKQSHWILRFLFKNLPIIVTTMILLNHLKLDLKCLGKAECLLSINSH